MGKAQRVALSVYVMPACVRRADYKRAVGKLPDDYPDAEDGGSRNFPAIPTEAAEEEEDAKRDAKKDAKKGEGEDDGTELRVFQLPDFDERYNRVQMYGSVDGWREMPDLQYDATTGKWFIYLSVDPGIQHEYKFLVNGGRWIVNND